MAKMFDPTRNAVGMCSRAEEARVALKLLAKHVDRLKVSYPKGADFIEDMASRLAMGGKDLVITEKQLEFLRGLCERNTGSLPEEHMKNRKPGVVWKR